MERDLHDGAQQRLVQTVISLKLARRALERGDDRLPALIDESLRHAELATNDLRDLVYGILPASLSRGGLRAGVETLVSGLPLPVTVDVTPRRLPGAVEITGYFVVAEALTNVVKHARATQAWVTAQDVAGVLWITVRDDGVGGATAGRGSGLTGLADRVEAAEGTLAMASPPGEGTALTVALPLPPGEESA
jgi:signal transduction histidine kinase